MKKSNKKHQYLMGFILTVLTWIVYVQTTDTVGPVRTASADQVLKASAVKLPGEGLDLFAFSPDGKTLASTNANGQIVLWNVASGQARLTLPGQVENSVSRLVFSPDGNTLASVSDNSIRLWDAISGNVLLSLPGSVFVTDLAFSPNGRILATVGQDAHITLRNSQSGSIIQILTGDPSGVNAIEFSPDSKTLAAGSQDARIKLWDSATGLEKTSLPGVVGAAVTDLVYSPNGKILAAVSQDARITLWDSQSGSTTQVLSGDPSGVNAIAFSPDSKILAAGGQNAQIKLWDTATGLEQARLPGESGVAVTGLVFSPDGKSLASVGESEPVYLWDVANKLPQLLTGHTDWVDKVIFSANQKTLTSVGKTGQVVVWNVMTGLEQSFFQVPALSNASVNVGLTSGNLLTNNPITNTNTSMAVAAGPALPNGNGQTVNGAAVGQNAKSTNKKRSNHDWKGVTALAVSADGTLYGGATKDGTVRLWTSDGTERFSNSGHHGDVVTGVAFSANGKGLVSVGRDSEIHTWDAATGKLDKILQGHEGAIRTVAASPDGKYLASAGEETRVMLWDAKTGKLLKILTGQTDFINAVSFSADSSQLASAGADSRILVWDVKTGQLAQTLLGHLSEVNTVAFSKDGKFLASGSTDSQVILWNAATGQQLQSFSEHQASVRAVAFSPNGQKLVSAGEDAKIMVRDTKTRKLVNQISGSANPVSALVFDPLGHLMAGSEDGDITEWDVEKGEKQQVINVPVQPQSNISGRNLEFPFTGSSRYVAGNTGYPTDPTPQNLTKLELAPIFYKLMDWLIPAAEAAIPTPPGGPLLIVTSSCPTCGIFNPYYAEILRAEGFNEFAEADISTLTAATLAAYDVVILASTPLTPIQVTLFTNWVNGGGNLIAIRPDPQLTSLLGLTANGTALSNAYLLVDTTRAPGNGIVNQPIQFHGASDGYSLSGATSLATIYSNASTATTKPALTLVSVGIKGGQAAAFTYDLATSIVYTRQGNPAWQAQERDGLTPIRSDDKYYGNATGNPQPDWVDLNNEVAVPQADEQQRLLANLITGMNLAKKPLPRFWYFPNGKKAVIIMTGDDHGNGGTGPRFDQFMSLSPVACSSSDATVRAQAISNWECVRGTSYIYIEPTLSNPQAVAYTAAGFEVGLHINTNCADYTPVSLEAFYVQQLAAFNSAYPGIPNPITQRHHCIAWSDWTTGAKTELNHGIRLDTSYYFWPPAWVNDRPGHFTGSAMPMRFADLSGNLIDVYQAVSHMTDESGQTYPFTVDTLLDRALGAPGYYGAYTINAHTDLPTEKEATDTVNSALARSVPVVSSVQMLTWLDGRNNSSFGNLSWNGNALGFTVTPGTGANGLQAMLPTRSSATNSLVSVTTGSGSSPVAFTTDTIKGIEYAFFPAVLGTYTATYQALPLTVNTTVLPSGSAAAPYSATLTAKGGTLPYSWLIVSGALPAGLVLNPGTGAISGTPTASGIFNFSVKVTDSASPAGTSTQVLSINITVPANLTIWPSSTVPGLIDGGPDSSVELGVKFKADTNGTLTGIRFYKASTNTGTHIGNLWSSTGTLLASATFSGETASGWQQVNFSTPVAITANTVYVASYHANAGHYSADLNYFTSTGKDSPPLHALANGVSGGDGVYVYGATSAFPNLTYISTNYWVDVAFTPMALMSLAVTPANPAILIGVTQPFTATGTYSDSSTQNLTTQSTWVSSNTAATINASGVATGVSAASTTITATSGGVSGNTTLTVNAATVQLAITTSSLPAGTQGVVYPATALTATGGKPPYTAWSISSGALPAGLSLTSIGTITGTPTASGTFSFTAKVTDSTTPTPSAVTKALSITVAATQTNLTLWPGTVVPGLVDGGSDSPVELGVKFRSDVAGKITGIRFYKAGTNTGTHVGNLWSSTGTKLATVTFSGETASGWQQMLFSTPVAITANTVYVASYHANAGHYSADLNYFSLAGLDNPPLHALANGISGGDGVYAYGATSAFPTLTWFSANYWVDVVFITP